MSAIFQPPAQWHIPEAEVRDNKSSSRDRRVTIQFSSIESAASQNQCAGGRALIAHSSLATLLASGARGAARGLTLRLGPAAN